MTNPAEYFAETTEAFFAQNDFYPFNKAELIETDPAMAECLTKIWNVVKEPK
jgi:dipeptidyl-peptidase-4